MINLFFLGFSLIMNIYILNVYNVLDLVILMKKLIEYIII